MYAEHTPVHTIAQIVIALYFIWMNQEHPPVGHECSTDRSTEFTRRTVPPDRFTIQFTGAFLVLFDWHTKYGATLLIAFVILASTLHHRFWGMKDR